MALVMRLSMYMYLLIFVSNFGLGSCERTSKKIYIPLTHVQGCFRRLNATHQIGCSSKRGGNIGVIHNIETDADLEWILEYGPHAPYIPVMSSINFNVTNVKRLKDSGKISGILVSHILSNESTSPLPPDGSSPAHSCPLDALGMYGKNSDYGHCKQVTWNPVGSSLMYEDLGIPIFIILNETEFNWLIYDCYEKFNKPGADGKARPYPLCSAELKSNMYAAKDAVTCIRRTNHVMSLNTDQFCDPLGDKNIYATVKQINNTEEQPTASVILVSARIDSFTLFEQTTPSADNDVTGFIALLAAAQALTESGLRDKIQNNSTSKDIMFTFFQGESFDYIGSSRMVYEMEKNRFPKKIADHDDKTYLHPINLTHLSHLLEVNQLGLGAGQGAGHVWLHSDPISRNITAIDKEVEKMEDNLVKFGGVHSITVKSAASSQPLPPASVQRFLMKHSLPTIVMTDHQKEFTNQYYQSRFDISDNIDAGYPSTLNRSDWYDHVTPQAERLADRAALLAEFLYYLSTGEEQFVPVNTTLVTHLLYCFLHDGKCDLFKTVLEKKDADKLTSQPYPFYVSVARNTNHVSTLTKKLLAYFLGNEVKNCTAPENDKLYSYIKMQGPADENGTRAGICMKSTAAFSEAKSPVFLDEMDGYDWASGEYSSWTESTWDTFSVRLFLVPSKQFQTATLSSGVILLLVSLVLVYFLNSNALILFSPNGPY